MTEKDKYPLVSALMIIHHPRPTILQRAIECFESQTYPYKELIIINNAKTQFEASEIDIEARRDVFMVDTPHKLPAGQAKNYGISASNGRILAQFDVDCWHDPRRLETQIATMAENMAHICVLSKTLQFSYNSGRASYWTNSKNAILNSMVFSRPSKIDYPPTNKSEELGILNKMTQSGLKIIAMDKPELMCKIFDSEEPVDEVLKSTLSSKHKSVISKILKGWKTK